MAELKYTQFFKVLQPAFENRLSIPKAFSRYLDGHLDRGVIWSCQGSWPVKVARSRECGLSFEEGWEQFVKHHLLKEIDFLVFKHTGNMIFDVVMYEPTGCEKEFTSASRMKTSCDNWQGKTPSFDVMMSETHRSLTNSYVTIPVAFVTSYGLGGRTSMILRRAGKEWAVDLGTWKGSAEGDKLSIRTAIRTKGWREFYKANKLKDGDLCTFELLEVPKSREKPVTMDVRITRRSFSLVV